MPDKCLMLHKHYLSCFSSGKWPSLVESTAAAPPIQAQTYATSHCPAYPLGPVQVLPDGGEPAELREALRQALPHAPKQQMVHEPAILHTTIARVLAMPSVQQAGDQQVSVLRGCQEARGVNKDMVVMVSGSVQCMHVCRGMRAKLQVYPSLAPVLCKC